MRKITQVHPVDKSRPAGKLNYLSAIESLHLLERGEITALALLEDCLAQIGEFDGLLQAWVHLDCELGKAQARAVDEKIRSGQRVGPLAGVPVGIKDIFNAIDMPTQMGSPIWKGFMPGNDARVVHSLRMADAVLPGKTVTAEFAVHTPGPTRNPHDPQCTPGTSSSGSAVAVASYMVPLALGTQTAGSILRPASYCGIYGFKPSFGLIPRTGMLKTTDTLDTVGYFARTVEDLELLLGAIRVHGPDYPLSHAALNDPSRQEKGSRPWRVAFVRGPKWDDAEAYARTAVEGFAKRLGMEEGVILEEVALSDDFSKAHDVHGVIYDKTLAYYFKEECRHHTLISPIMYEIVERGKGISLAQYQAGLQEQSRLVQQFDEMLQRYDALLTLTTGGAAQKGLDTTDRPDTCLIWTLCGAPAVNLPVFSDSRGMPFGAQIIGRRYNDLLLLKFARFLRGRQLIPQAPNPIPAFLKSAHS